MDQETKGLLEDIKRLENENNSLLLKLHNSQKWNLISRIVYWFILLGIAVGAFYFIKPFKIVTAVFNRALQPKNHFLFL
jgi:hypothetical protein